MLVYTGLHSSVPLLQHCFTVMIVEYYMYRVMVIQGDIFTSHSTSRRTSLDKLCRRLAGTLLSACGTSHSSSVSDLSRLDHLRGKQKNKDMDFLWPIIQLRQGDGCGSKFKHQETAGCPSFPFTRATHFWVPIFDNHGQISHCPQDAPWLAAQMGELCLAKIAAVGGAAGCAEHAVRRAVAVAKLADRRDRWRGAFGLWVGRLLSCSVAPILFLFLGGCPTKPKKGPLFFPGSLNN